MTATRPRRTQQERSTQTRQAVLDATIEALVEHGYAGTSTTVIQKRAGVSRGALTHQFPSKQALMVAAIQHLAEARVSEAAELVAGSTPPEDRRLEWGIRQLWREAMEGPLLAAVVELWNAARTDETLRLALVEVERAFAPRLLVQLTTLFGPEIAGRPGFPRAVEAVLTHMRGAALTSILRKDPRRYAPSVDDSIRIFRALLAAPTEH